MSATKPSSSSPHSRTRWWRCGVAREAGEARPGARCRPRSRRRSALDSDEGRPVTSLVDEEGAHLAGAYSAAACPLRARDARPEPEPSRAPGIMNAMKIVSVMTTDSSGGAEFAAVEMLEALRRARQRDRDAHRHARDRARTPASRSAPLDIGPKLSTRSWPGLALRWPLLLRRLRARARGRGALRRAARPLQEGAADGAGLPAKAAPHASCGRSGARCPTRCARGCRGGPTCAPPSGRRS